MTQKRPMMFLLLISILLSLAACSSTDVHIELAVCGSYAVPGMFCSDLKGGSFSCEIWEEDGQGRILYEYTTTNHISQKEETVLLICQKIDDSYVYFYEDICYLSPGYTAEDIELLKDRNDWDAAVDETKLSRRTKTISFDLYIVPETFSEYRSLRTACIQALQITEEQVQDILILDADGRGKELYLLVAENDTGEQQFLTIVDAAYHVSTMEIIGGIVSPDEVATFKQESEWSYES